MKIQDQLRLMAEDWHSRLGYNQACELLSRAADKIDDLEKQRDELLVKVAAWEQKAANWMASPEAAQRLDGYRDLAQRLNIAEQQRDELLVALENCRLLAARHRKEEWAGHVLRFCGESGVAGKVMR